MSVREDYVDGVDDWAADDANAFGAAINDAYILPVDGIPSSDMASAVQTSLGKADSAEQAANKGAASGYCGLNGSALVDISDLPTGATSSTVCVGNDSRLSDTRTPTDSSVTDAKINGDSTIARILIWDGDSWPDRPNDNRPTIFVGGSEATDAPDDADLVSGDVWIPATA